jgi:hypothetical protein
MIPVLPHRPGEAADVAQKSRREIKQPDIWENSQRMLEQSPSWL